MAGINFLQCAPTPHVVDSICTRGPAGRINHAPEQGACKIVCEAVRRWAQLGVTRSQEAMAANEAPFPNILVVSCNAAYELVKVLIALIAKGLSTFIKTLDNSSLHVQNILERC